MIALALDAPRSANPINHYILSWREGEYQAGSSAANVTRNPCSNRRSPELALRRRRSRAGNHARAAAGSNSTTVPPLKYGWSREPVCSTIYRSPFLPSLPLHYCQPTTA